MKFCFKEIGTSLLILSSTFTSYGQSEKVQENIPLTGKYAIQINSNILKKNGAFVSINFDSSETNFQKFLPVKSNDTLLLSGSLGQPRIVEVSIIQTNDSTVNIFNSYEKNIDPSKILTYKFYCTPGLNKLTIVDSTLQLQSTNIYQKDYINYGNILNQHVKKYIDPVLAAYQNASKENDSVKIKALAKEYQLKTSDAFEADKVDYPFIKAHPNSPVSLYVLTLVYSNNHLDTVQNLLHSLASPIQNLPTAINIKNLILSAKTNAIGKIATNFTLKDTSNNQVSLSDYKGKYVLIDFWASWCAPCRAENPNVVKAYNKFKNKNFTIISISLDDSQKNWLNAVKNDHLEWAQLSELKGWDGKVSHDYAVTSIPTNYLIDPSGKIIAKNLRGAELEEALAKYL